MYHEPKLSEPSRKARKRSTLVNFLNVERQAHLRTAWHGFIHTYMTTHRHSTYRGKSLPIVLQTACKTTKNLPYGVHPFVQARDVNSTWWCDERFAPVVGPRDIGPMSSGRAHKSVDRIPGCNVSNDPSSGDGVPPINVLYFCGQQGFRFETCGF